MNVSVFLVPLIPIELLIMSSYIFGKPVFHISPVAPLHAQGQDRGQSQYITLIEKQIYKMVIILYNTMLNSLTNQRLESFEDLADCQRYDQ